MSFEGKRVLALESRRAPEIAELIRRQGGEPFVAPSMREVPIEQNAALMEFAERLSEGDFDMMVLLTGVGTRQMNRALAEAYQENTFADALRKLTVVARGPKPVAALREMGLKANIVAPEPTPIFPSLRCSAAPPSVRRAALVNTMGSCRRPGLLVISLNCLKSLIIGMYGPPLCRKRKVRIAGTVCAYVFGLVGVFNDPGLDGMRFALFLVKFSVFKDPYRNQVSRTTVRPWCHLFLRQQTWQENLNSAAVAGLRMWKSR